MLGFFVGFLLGGVAFIVGLIGGAELLNRLLATDWAAVAEENGRPVRSVKENTHE